MSKTKWVLSPLLLFAAHVLFRYQIIQDLGMTASQAWGALLHVGLIYDFAVVLGVVALTQVFWGACKIPQRLSWVILSSVVWIASLSNILYFRYFRGWLEWWIVKLHFQDIGVVGGSIEELGLTVPILLSVFCFLLSCFVFAWRPQSLRPRLRALVTGCLVLSSAFLLRQSPVWFKWVQVGSLDKGSLVQDQILTIWWNENFGNLQGFSDQMSNSTVDGKNALSLNPLIEFRNAGEVLAGNQLLRTFQPDSALTRQLRLKLGLPEKGPINVIALFVESWRAFETLHPELRKKILPRMSEIFDRQSIFFTQAYSSSFSAGQTVRGQFSSLCSSIPNLTGAAVYIAYPGLRIHCIQSLLQDQGYQTLWLSGFPKSFHNSSTFDSIHGTETFYDEQDFVKMGVKDKLAGWAIGDFPFLDHSIEILEKHAEKGRPFFANMITLSTHHPHSVIPEGHVPEEVIQKVGKDSPYHRFLSRLTYTDRALGNFFDRLFASKLGENTLVVILGDHSNPVKVHEPLSERQEIENHFRITLALVTKHLRKPERIDKVTHQIDIAPTIAEIAGVSGQVAWLGQSLFSSRDSQWVYQEGSVLHYRRGSRSCYSLASGIKCFNAQTSQGRRDPLFEVDLPEIPEVPAETDFFRQLVRANKQAIIFNRILPREDR